MSDRSELALTLQERLNAARKAQDKPRALLLGTILAAVKNREIELRRPPTDEEVVEVLRKGIKTRRESVEQYRAAAREDLAEKEAAEIRMLEEFLPPAADPAEIRAAVREAIAAGATDLGRVMGQVMPRFKGRADGKLINQIAREELQVG
ncbi:MAG TPA: GatB/YqeY domain-containing protein [Gemmatimonadales bacterium]|nr:GatB/YqeY domain-containing protein [Gemmatimonadales bacterium]